MLSMCVLVVCADSVNILVVTFVFVCATRELSRVCRFVCLLCVLVVCACCICLLCVLVASSVCMFGLCLC